MSAFDWLSAEIGDKTEQNGVSEHTEHTRQNMQNGKCAHTNTPQTRMDKGFQNREHTEHTEHTDFQSPRENTEKQGDSIPTDDTAAVIIQPPPRATIPADLLTRVNLICRLESWVEVDRLEWIDILQRQIDNDKTPPAELVATLDAHLDRWHRNTSSDDREVIEERAAIMEYDGGLPRAEAERLACIVNECTGCMFWKGAQSVPAGRYTALSAAGVDVKPKSNIVGMCARYNKPWRVSNIASDPDYQRWHFIGQCGRKAA
jgi:hypothetical protein